MFLLRWFVLLGVVALTGLVTQGRAFQSGVGGIVAVVGYLVLLIATILHFCGLAMSELQDNLRTLSFGINNSHRL